MACNNPKYFAFIWKTFLMVADDEQRSLKIQTRRNDLISFISRSSLVCREQQSELLSTWICCICCSIKALTLTAALKVVFTIWLLGSRNTCYLSCLKLGYSLSINQDCVATSRLPQFIWDESKGIFLCVRHVTERLTVFPSISSSSILLALYIFTQAGNLSLLDAIGHCFGHKVSPAWATTSLSTPSPCSLNKPFS